MKVSLMDYTGAGSPDPARHAANLLVFTKQTRLNMDPDQFDNVAAMPWSGVEKELEYMANTIPSSWEFVEYKFLINGVSRGFTHQFVRTRTGSYAQQTMRVLDVSGWDYLTGPTIPDEDAMHRAELMAASDQPGYLSAEDVANGNIYHEAMREIAGAYDQLVKNGVAIEDARGILPTNILTNIVAKFDLRTMTDLARKRASSRTQGEYREVLEAMKAEIIRVHPWTEMFFNRSLDVAAQELEELVQALYVGTEEFTHENKIKLIKLVDQMRKG